MCPQKGQDTIEYGKTETTLDKLFSHISTYSVTEMYVLFPKNGNAKQTRIMVDVKYMVSIGEAVDDWHCAV